MVQQIDIAGIIWNHITALQRRYYRMYGGYINKYRMMKHIAKLRNGKRSEWKLLGSQARLPGFAKLRNILASLSSRLDGSILAAIVFVSAR